MLFTKKRPVSACIIKQTSPEINDLVKFHYSNYLRTYLNVNVVHLIVPWALSRGDSSFI